jgi:putative membrane protein
MFLNRRIKLSVILRFAWRMQLYSFCLGVLVYVLYESLDLQWVAIPFLPVATIGTAVAFYVGFKNNSAYDRLWEARRIWGNITNTSRMWAAMVMKVAASRNTAEPGIPEQKKEVLYRHIAWMNMLRIQLRRSPVFNEKEYTSSPQFLIIQEQPGEHSFEKELEAICRSFLSEEEKKSVTRFNPASFLLHRQTDSITEWKNRGWLDPFEHSDMVKMILDCYNQQGSAERIKSFPFPRQYANFSNIFVNIFITLLPFAMINDLDKLGNGTTWLVVPFSMLIAWVFNVMEQIGDASENPFDNGINDIPMNTICRNIEIELRELLGEKDLPPRLQPVEGILM